LFPSFWYLAFRCVLQLVLLRPHSTEFKELEIVVLRHQLAATQGGIEPTSRIPATPGAEVLLTARIPANSRSGRKRHDRPVTPEVAALLPRARAPCLSASFATRWPGYLRPVAATAPLQRHVNVRTTRSMSAQRSVTRRGDHPEHRQVYRSDHYSDQTRDRRSSEVRHLVDVLTRSRARSPEAARQTRLPPQRLDDRPRPSAGRHVVPPSDAGNPLRLLRRLLPLPLHYVALDLP
jgi:hypothetical protein